MNKGKQQKNDIHSSNLKGNKLQLRIADTFFSRLIGLLGTKNLNKTNGIIIRSSNFVHTFGMRYSLDIIFLDNKFQEVKRVEKLKPWRFAYCAKAVDTVELSAGFCAQNPDYMDQIKSALLSNNSAKQFNN